MSDSAILLLDYGDPEELPELHCHEMMKEVSSVHPLANNVQNLSVAQVPQQDTKVARESAQNLFYNHMTKKGNPSKKNVSTSGSKVQLCQRLVTWFYLRYRQDKHGVVVNHRPLSTSTNWTSPEITRLVEIMVDPNLASSILLLHVPASRGNIDCASSGSINDTVGGNVVSKKFNDLDLYKPPYRFQGDVDLSVFDPNDRSISARGSDSCKSSWASLRSEFSIVFAR